MKEAAVFVEVIRELDRKEYDFEETVLCLESAFKMDMKLAHLKMN